jgi:hypothetical protein
MTPDIISALVNFGMGGAVILVVKMFIQYIREQNELNSTNQEKLVTAINCLTKEIGVLQDDLHTHDAKVDTRISVIQATAKGRAQGGVK